MDSSAPFIPCKNGYINFLNTPTNRFVFFNANRIDKKETILFCDAVENLVLALPQALEKVNNLTEEQIAADPGVIFSKDLSCFSGIGDQDNKNLMFKNCLSVNTYESNVYIWIKRYFFDTEKQIWSACRGGFRFAPKVDNIEEVLDFLKKHLEYAKSSKNQWKNKKNATVTATAAVAAAAAAATTATTGNPAVAATINFVDPVDPIATNETQPMEM